MIRVGVLGSQNEHSLLFSRIINTTCDDIRVTHIFGTYPELTKQRAEGADIANIVKTPEDMIDEVDAVIVDFRNGALHLSYALPFIRAGKIVFVDKPFTNSIKDVKTLLDAAAKSGAVITGGSDMKYLKGVIDAKEYVSRMRANGELISGGVAFKTLDIQEYGGLHFYGPHTVEPALTIFGYEVRSVYASRMDNRDIIAILSYADLQIILHFMFKTDGFYINIVTNNEYIHSHVADNDSSNRIMENFIRVLHTKKSDLEDKNILMPVAVMNALYRSLETGSVIQMSEVLNRDH